MDDFPSLIMSDRDHDKNRLECLIHLQDRSMDKIMFYANNSQLVIGPVTKHRLPEGYTRLLFTHADSEYQILIDSKSPHLSRIQSIIRNIRLNEATIDYLERKMRRTRPRT